MTEKNDIDVTYVDIDTLTPDPENAKKHTKPQIRYIANSIDDFGAINPLVLWHDGNGRNIILAGNGRYEAAKYKGIKRLPAIQADYLTKDEARAYALADNKTNVMTGFDKDKLKAALAKLPDKLDITKYGFTPHDFGWENTEVSQRKTVTYHATDHKWDAADLWTPANATDNTIQWQAIQKVKNPGIRKMLRRRFETYFTKFNYSRIADYYINQATPDEREALEATAMVLLDYQHMIDNGFFRLQDIVESNRYTVDMKKEGTDDGD